MHEPYPSVLQAIQAILVPALGISAVGLLLLGLTNRYSSIINRIRLLNEERRKYVRMLAEKNELSVWDNIRFMNIRKQSEELLVRSRLVRNAILSLQLAIGLFVLTSVSIAVNLFLGDLFSVAPLIVFVAGMLGVLLGVVFSAIEVYRSFTIVLLEVRAEE